MSALRLRRVDAAEAVFRLAVRDWQQRGIALQYCAPHAATGPRSESPHLAFRMRGEHGGWQGLIEAGPWLCNAAPALAALATGAIDMAHVAQLFAATPQPLTVPQTAAAQIRLPVQTPTPLAYIEVESCTVVPGAGLTEIPLASLDLPQGRVWLSDLPAWPVLLPQSQSQSQLQLQLQPILNPEHVDGADRIPALLQFSLGHSYLSHGRLSRLETGDVLLISHQALRVRCHDLLLGSYSFHDEGISVDKLLNQPAYEPLDETTGNAGFLDGAWANADDEADAETEVNMDMAPDTGANNDDNNGDNTDGNTGTPPAAIAATGSTGRLGAAALARIPVRLEFILQRRTLSVGELGALQEGQIIALDERAEKQVLVLGNGVVLGRGELIQLDDRLGIEMLDIHGPGSFGSDDAD